MVPDIKSTAKLRSLIVQTKDGDWGKKEPQKGFIPYNVIRGADFPAMRVGDVSNVPICYLKKSTVHRRTLEPEDIIIETAGGSHNRPTGRTVFITERLLSSFKGPATCASFCRFLRINKSKAVPRYIYWYLQYMYESRMMWEHQVQHTGVARFQWTKFADSVEIPLPPMKVQHAIAHILGTLEDKIELNRQMNETLEAMARAIFKSWFVDFEPVRAKAEGRDPGLPKEIADLFPDSFESSKLGQIPKGWKVVTIGDAVDINKTNIKNNEIGGEIEYIDISSVSVGKLTESKIMDFAHAPSRARRRVKHGDTIWSCVRPNRKSYYFIHMPPSNILVSTGFAVLSSKRITPCYLYSYTTTQEFVEYLTSNADGSAYPAVRADHFSVADLLLPNREVLNNFEWIIAPMRDQIAQNDLESHTLSTIRDDLLPKLLSGEIRVPDAEKFIKEYQE